MFTFRLPEPHKFTNPVKLDEETFFLARENGQENVNYAYTFNVQTGESDYYPSMPTDDFSVIEGFDRRWLFDRPVSAYFEAKGDRKIILARSVNIRYSTFTKFYWLNAINLY